MKRLRYYILNMNPKSETYEEIYEGRMIEAAGQHDAVIHNHAVYWDDEIGYEITKSNRLDLSKPTVNIHIPIKYFHVEDTSCAALDYIYREFIPFINELNQNNANRKRTARENGYYYIYEPNNKVQRRNVVSTSIIPQKYYSNPTKDTIIPFDDIKEVVAYPCISIMLQVQLPEGKHKKAIQMLTKDLPEAVRQYIAEFRVEGYQETIELSNKQEQIRKWLKENNHIAFVANGSILPREKETDNPMQQAIPFVSTKEDETELFGIKGMLFKSGVTVITGGGYSGKSTLLDALCDGVYNHRKGDGREYVITDADSMKISAEDGRSVIHANLSPFIKWIPGGNPSDFNTSHASGSTSQAANIMECINWGCKTLMIDEDKSATNFMIQDVVMKALIAKEPITPFVTRVQELYQTKGVSTILVIGGSSEYLEVADRIYMMNEYQISHITKEAKRIRSQSMKAATASLNIINNVDIRQKADWNNSNLRDANTISAYPEESSTEVLKVSDLGFLVVGDNQIDIRMLHNIATLSQLNAIAFIIRTICNRINPLERF